jgi:F-type H+-transporting ATPase subunit delta
MPTDRTVIRKAVGIYAQTLLEAAKDAGTVFEVSGQLEQASKAIRGNMSLRNTLSDRTLDGVSRAGIAKEIFAGLDTAVVEVLGVLVERDEIALLPRVTETYVYLAEEALDSVFIDVTTVVELDDALRDSIKKKYSAQFGKGIMLREHVDPALVGGIVLSSHGSKVDASVVTQLDKARLALAAGL